MTVADSRIDELRRRLERDPGSRLFAQLAEEHRKAGEHAEAIRVARAGLAVHPAYPSARLTLGRALLESGDAAGGRVELEAALHDAPDNILASRLLGQALEALGELGPALQQLEKTLKMAPGDRPLEAQILALRTQLGAMPTRSAAPVTAPSRPPSAAPPPPEEGQGELPATILIHRQGDRSRVGPLSPPPVPSLPLATSDAPRSPAPPAPALGTAAAAPPVSISEAPTPSPPVAAEEASVPTGRESAPPPPTLPMGALTVEETVFEAEGGPEGGGEGPASVAAGGAWAVDAAAEEATPFSSSTLAELYFRQGLVETAVEVYRQVLADEPENERARTRLDEITSALPLDERAAGRRQLERTIAGLEGILAALRKRRA